MDYFCTYKIARLTSIRLKSAFSFGGKGLLEGMLNFSQKSGKSYFSSLNLVAPIQDGVEDHMTGKSS